MLIVSNLHLIVKIGWAARAPTCQKTPEPLRAIRKRRYWCGPISEVETTDRAAVAPTRMYEGIRASPKLVKKSVAGSGVSSTKPATSTLANPQQSPVNRRQPAPGLVVMPTCAARRPLRPALVAAGSPPHPRQCDRRGCATPQQIVGRRRRPVLARPGSYVV